MSVAQRTNRVGLLFRAFSDRTRLRILNLLRDGELCVCDIIDALDVPQAKVSRHLAYLRRARLVEARKQGVWSYYSLTPPKGEFHAKLIECLGCCFGEVPELAKDADRLGRMDKAKACCR